MPKRTVSARPRRSWAPRASGAGRARHGGANGCDCDVSEPTAYVMVCMPADTIEHNRRPQRRRLRSGWASVPSAPRPRPAPRLLARGARERSIRACHRTPYCRRRMRRIAGCGPACARAARLDLFHPWGLSTEEAIDIARRCERRPFSVQGKSATRRCDRRRSPVAVRLRQQPRLRGGYPGSRHWISCSVIAEDKA